MKIAHALDGREPHAFLQAFCDDFFLRHFFSRFGFCFGFPLLLRWSWCVLPRRQKALYRCTPHFGHFWLGRRADVEPGKLHLPDDLCSEQSMRSIRSGFISVVQFPAALLAIVRSPRPCVDFRAMAFRPETDCDKKTGPWGERRF
jgi:hypothetical protein